MALRSEPGRRSAKPLVLEVGPVLKWVPVVGLGWFGLHQSQAALPLVLGPRQSLIMIILNGLGNVIN
jgi:hypothetical protein